MSLQPTHAEIANEIQILKNLIMGAAKVMEDRGESIVKLNARLDEIDAKLEPISELYTTGKVGGSIFKWCLTVLVAIAGIWGFFYGTPK